MSSSSATPPLEAKPGRLVSLDAYRGFIMLVLVAEGFGISQVARGFSGVPFWDFAGYQFSHAPWTGCAFWDLIQPAFTFMVGVAMPYSYASRRARGDARWYTIGHVIKRALVLIFLGIFLRSGGSEMTRFTFEDTLTQIGLGYGFVYLVLGRGVRVQMGALVAILVGYWLAFALYPLPGPGFDYSTVGLGNDWPWFTGFFQHWDKNTNLAHHFDVWFLNLFPRPEPFAYNGGGYLTLSFIPTMATMIFGVLAGEWLRGEKSPGEKFKGLFVSGAICLALGLLFHFTVCPSVKRIWTPSWAIFSAGWTIWMLAAFYWVVDIKGYRAWTFPLLVVGMNSIFMYCSSLVHHWIADSLKTHIGQGIFDGPYGPMVHNTSIALVIWLVGWWMYRRKIFIRI